MEPKPAGWSIKQLLEIVTTVAMLLTCAVVIWAMIGKPQTGVANDPARSRPDPVIPKDPLKLSDLATKGNTTAAAAMIIFSDFECPFCARFANETLPSLVSKYVDSGKLLLGFRHLPIEGIHKDARAAAELSVCAEQEGRFWAVHDQFFRPSGKGLASFSDRAEKGGLSKQLIASCSESQRAKSRVDQDLALARSLQIRSTPLFLIGSVTGDGVKVDKIVKGARPLEEFERAIDESVAKASK